MSDLLTNLTVTAVAPFLFNTGTPVTSYPDMFQINPKQSNVIAKEAPKKEVKEVKVEEPVETPTPQVVTYIVQEGDNLSGIADKHNLSWMRIWQKNTQIQNQDTLKVGDTLTIPNTEEALSERPPVTPPEAPVSVSSPQVAQVANSEPTTSYTAPQTVTRPSPGGPNAYAYGWCTWWVKEKRPDIGGYWGNAVSWLGSASAAGYSTGSVPVPGSIAYTPEGPYGHVAYVESVNGNTVTISEMGYGYTSGRLNYRTVHASSFTYIY